MKKVLPEIPQFPCTSLIWRFTRLRRLAHLISVHRRSQTYKLNGLITEITRRLMSELSNKRRFQERQCDARNGRSAG